MRPPKRQVPRAQHRVSAAPGIDPDSRRPVFRKAAGELGSPEYTVHFWLLHLAVHAQVGGDLSAMTVVNAALTPTQ